MKGRDTRTAVEASLRRRRRKEVLFRLSGLVATAVGIVFLSVFFASLIGQGASAFSQTFIELDIEYSKDVLAPEGELDLDYADFDAVVRNALWQEFPGVTDRRARRDLLRLVSAAAGFQLRDALLEDPELLGTRERVAVPASATVDMLVKGNIDRSLNEARRPLTDRQLEWIDQLAANDRLEMKFGVNTYEVPGARPGTTSREPMELVRDIEITLPEGIQGNPEALPKCPMATFNREACPSATIVGRHDLFYKGTRDVEFEGHSRNNYYRGGWRVGMVEPGDEVTLIAAPTRDGSDGGYVLGVITKDGVRF